MTVAEQSIRERLLAEALETLLGCDLSYQGPTIVIPCESHGAAIKRVFDARAALAQYRGERG